MEDEMEHVIRMTTKQKLAMPEAAIFDMDGTLFKTETLLEYAHGRLFGQLKAEGLYPVIPPLSAVLDCLGMLLPDIWRKVMPDASEAAHRRADELLLAHEIGGLAAGEGELYPDVRETLEALRARGIKLFVASNGLQPYVEAIVSHRGLSDLFESGGLYTAGGRETATKAELVGMLLREHGIRRAWMVGDRSSDVHAGLENGLEVVGCAYAGFGEPGELDGSHAVIQDFRELLGLLPDRDMPI